MINGQKPEQLLSLTVRNLFRRFNYKLRFGEEEYVSIITAPNGYGKTVLLRIIDSFFNRKLGFFQKISFEKIVFQLSSGKQISILKDEGGLIDSEEIREKRAVSIKATGFGADKELYLLAADFSLPDLRYFEHRFPVEQIGPDLWHDFHQGRTFATDQIIELYADRLPQKLLDSLKLPEWLQDAIASVDTHLIET